MNFLYYGDNLDVLRRHVKDESVDLVYLDPPFKSNQDYNVLFAEHGTRSAAQIKAFEDTWRWDEAAAYDYEQTVESGGRVAQAMLAFRTLLGTSDMLAYLAMMAPRLVELHRALKPTGSLYLHCDPAASHYLKLLLDAVFGPTNFRSEIIWKRTGAHGSAKRYAPVHDVILYFAASAATAWHQTFHAYSDEYLETKYRYEDERGRYRLITLFPPGVRKGETGTPWRGIDPTAKGLHWRFQPSRLEKLDAEGMIYWGQKQDALPQLKRYLDMSEGVPAQDIWTDISPINSQARERLGYPTQKPEALLARIVSASSNEGDLVLDPFCGCGTAIAVAQQMNRRWVGIDITHLAINLIRHRLRDTYGPDVEQSYRVIGEPVTLDDAGALARSDPYQFQWWALGLVGARPAEQKKGADKGIDGRIFFHDEKGGKTKQVILSVKAGKTGRAHVHELRGVIEREGAEIGVLISFAEPTKPMREEAASAGYYKSPGWQTSNPRIQLLTIADLLGGKGIEYPHMTGVTFKQAPKAQTVGPTAEPLFSDDQTGSK